MFQTNFSDDDQSAQTSDFQEANNGLPSMNDTAETITLSDDDTDSSVLVPYDEPLYQNQEDDPEVQNLIYQANFE